MKNILFIGSSEISIEILEELRQEHNIVGIVCQPDREVKIRKKIEIREVPIKSLCVNDGDYSNIPLYQPNNINEDTKFYDTVTKSKIDFIVVISYGQIISKKILDIAPCINIHPSLLPKYRGASPIESSLLNGDDVIGVSTMLMNEGMDSGDILLQEKINVENDDYFGSIMNRIEFTSCSLIMETIDNFEKINPIKQNDKERTYCSKLSKEDTIIDLESSIKSIQRKGMIFSDRGVTLKNGLKLYDIEIKKEIKNKEVGEIKRINDSLIIYAKNCQIEFKEIQIPGKRKMNIKDFMNGNQTLTNILNFN